MFIILIVALLGFAMTAPTPETCPAIMESAGISEDTFAPMVTHAIHSLTLEDIIFYFKADATEQNNIPIANLDWRSDEDRVLEHAPLVGYDDEFSTAGMRHFDMVMRNMKRTWWGVKNYSILEKVTHALHMAELWNGAGEQYKMVEKLLDPESDLCACVNDIENNGVLQFLNLLALKIRYPGITSGNETLTAPYMATRQKRRVKGYKLKYSIEVDVLRPSAAFRSTLMDFDFDRSDLELLQEVAEKLVDGDGVMEAPIDSAEHWDYWKQSVKTAMRDDLYYDLAVFMFCRLNMN